MANDYYSGLPSFLTPRDPGHTPGTPWTVLNPGTATNPEGTFQEVPWNDAAPLNIFQQDQGGGNYLNTATTDPDQIAHLERQMKTASNQAAIKIAAMILGGTALTGGFGGAGAASSAGGADALQPITTSASMLPGGTAGFLGAPASEGLSAFPALSGSAAGGALAGAGGAASAGVPGVPTIGGAAAGVPESAVAGTPDAVAASEAGGGSSGGSNMLQRLFHMGGNMAKGGGQQQPYRYQNPMVADYAQQQQAAEMLADALNKRQPVDPIVRGGPIPIGRY